MLSRALLAALVSALISGLLVRQLGRLGWLDRPNPRSSHRRSTPRGGGVAIVLAEVVLAPALEPLLLLPLPLALVGLADDRLDLPAALRLPVQLLTGFALARLVGDWPLPAALMGALLATGIINAVNFMDGLDGLVSSCLLVWFLLAALVVQVPALWLLAGALLGFLLWNWSPARLFMGDVGSTYLGAVVAGVLLLAARQGPAPSVLLLLAALPLLGDACWCLLRRAWARQPLWQAHRLHLYQRLQQAGWSHAQVAALYSLCTLALALIAWVLLPLSVEQQAPGIVAAISVNALLAWWLETRCALPFR
jgi:UDP-N-acetylmuramyl pentapeptide phosphotransferase/UDP-N-acetylglucosamine-1-phosphate transferase